LRPFWHEVDLPLHIFLLKRAGGSGFGNRLVKTDYGSIQPYKSRYAGLASPEKVMGYTKAGRRLLMAGFIRTMIFN
jgi:hypothetical protein